IRRRHAFGGPPGSIKRGGLDGGRLAFDGRWNAHVNCPVRRLRPPFHDGPSHIGNQSMNTFSPRPRDIERRWYVVNADGAVLGRLASEVAKVLRGKHKPIFAPHMDTGDKGM